MPAALLAANIQALVRSIAEVGGDPLALTAQMNRHLSRYTPIDRFATAVFIVLDHENRGTDLCKRRSQRTDCFRIGNGNSLEPTGMPLGVSPKRLHGRHALLPPGGTAPFHRRTHRLDLR